MSRRYKFVALLAAVLVLAVGGIAYASIPGPDGVIHGCYKTSNPAQGALIAIDSAASCPSGYAALNWNQTGPQGPAGANGVSGVEKVDFTPAPTNSYVAGQRYSVAVSCTTGKVVLGGGFSAPTDVSSAGYVVTSRPGGDPATEWRVEAIPNASYTGYGYSVYAICASVGS